MKFEKAENITKEAHKNMNSVVLGTAEQLKDAKIVYKLDDALKERGIT